MDERLKFVARRLAGEPMSDLCREFGISRETGYKIFDRCQECVVPGLTDRNRRRRMRWQDRGVQRFCLSWKGAQAENTGGRRLDFLWS